MTIGKRLQGVQGPRWQPQKGTTFEEGKKETTLETAAVRIKEAYERNVVL